jgi:alpha-galactosidase
VCYWAIRCIENQKLGIGQMAQSPLGRSYEAAASENTLTGDASVLKCSSCPGGKKVGDIGFGEKTGKNGTLQFNRISEKSTSDYMLSLYYISNSGGRVLDVSVNGKPPIVICASSTKKWNVVRTLSITVHLNAGYNTIKFFNPSARGPDIDSIVV